MCIYYVNKILVNWWKRHNRLTSGVCTMIVSVQRRKEMRV